MVKVALNTTVIYAGEIYEPGEHDVPKEVADSFRERGLVAPPTSREAKAAREASAKDEE